MKELKSELADRGPVAAEQHIISTRHRRLGARALAFSLQALALLLAFSLQPLAFAQTGQTVNWVGGNNYRSWVGSTNWNPQIVPLNAGGTNFTVIVPDGSSLRYDATNAGTIDALSLGASTVFLLTNGQPLQVDGVAYLYGQIEARKAGQRLSRALRHDRSFSQPEISRLGWRGDSPWREQLLLEQIQCEQHVAFCHRSRVAGGSQRSCSDATQLWRQWQLDLCHQREEQWRGGPFGPAESGRAWQR